MRESRRRLFGDVREVPRAVVVQEHAFGVVPVATRNSTTAHKQIDLAIAIKICGGHVRSTHGFDRQVAHHLAKAVVAIIQVQPVLQRRRHVGEFGSTADDIQIGASIAIRVEENCAYIFRQRVRLEYTRVRTHKLSIALLNEQLSDLILRATQIHVIESVTIHVGNGDRRSFHRQHLGNQTLAIEVDEVVFVMRVAQSDLCRHIAQQRRKRRGGRCCSHRAVGTLHADALIRGDVAQHRLLPVRPLHRDRIDLRIRTNPKRQQRLHARLEAAHRRLLLHELLTADPQRHARANGKAIASVTNQRNLQIVIVLEQRARIVAIDKRFHVDVVHHQIDCAIAVEITVCRAIRKTRGVQSPRLRCVGELQIALIMKRVVRDFGRTHRVDKTQEVDLPAVVHRFRRGLIRER